jgi:4-diphosphocytidyl-2-C-methyl-D-erythritol kinase
MVVFPNCKLNLGLYVLRKRQDGYHDLQTVFYPLNWCDALEVIEFTRGGSEFQLEISGLAVAGNIEDNLLFKCWKLLRQNHALPPLQIHLHKSLPMGAGLGGGSSDAAFFLNLLNTKFNLQLSLQERLELALQLGADCPFFILNKPVFAEGKGEVFSDIQVDLSRYYILCVFPNLHSNTSLAFQSIRPQSPQFDLRQAIQGPVKEWKNTIANDFENPVFDQFPILRTLKQSMYDHGALYASMSGSGSAMFGIFEEQPTLTIAENYLHFLQHPRP